MEEKEGNLTALMAMVRPAVWGPLEVLGRWFNVNKLIYAFPCFLFFEFGFLGIGPHMNKMESLSI